MKRAAKGTHEDSYLRSKWTCDHCAEVFKLSDRHPMHRLPPSGKHRPAEHQWDTYELHYCSDLCAEDYFADMIEEKLKTPEWASRWPAWYSSYLKGQTDLKGSKT